MVVVQVWADGRTWVETFTPTRWEIWKARFDKVGIRYEIKDD